LYVDEARSSIFIYVEDKHPKILSTEKFLGANPALWGPSGERKEKRPKKVL
jgi:hypothetical protein